MSKSVLNILNANDVETLTKLIQKLEESSFNYLKMENGEHKIIICKNGYSEPFVAGNGNVELNVGHSEESAQNTQHHETTVAITQQAEAVATVQAPPVKEIALEQEGIEIIKATTAGLFYAQSEPGAAPYVQVGEQVDEDTTIGLIEIMKVYSAISAGVSGVITAIHVEDAQLVEYGQPLFSVKVK